MADSLPDRFGNMLIAAWLARSGRLPESFNAVERYWYTGSRGKGALEYQPATRLPASGTARLEADRLVDLVSQVLAHRHSLQGWIDTSGGEIPLEDILRVGTSAVGEVVTFAGL